MTGWPGGALQSIEDGEKAHGDELGFFFPPLSLAFFLKKKRNAERKMYKEAVY
jgi:hypothetical protein